MRVEVEAPGDQIAAEARELLLFYLNRLEGEAERIKVQVERVSDCLAMPLTRCRVNVSAQTGTEFCVVETQADLALALTRALDRTVRTLHRRRGAARLALPA